MIIIVPGPRDAKIRMVVVPEETWEAGKAADNTKSDILVSSKGQQGKARGQMRGMHSDSPWGKRMNTQEPKKYFFWAYSVGNEAYPSSPNFIIFSFYRPHLVFIPHLCIVIRRKLIRR